MKRFLLIISVTTVFAACNSNGDSKNENNTLSEASKKQSLRDTSNYTTMEWTDSTYKDLGKIKKGQIVDIPFALKNTGNKPLIISSVQPSCGCTVAEKPEKPILPNQEEKIVAKFNSEGQNEGEHLKMVTVIANTKPITQHTLTFKVEVTK